MRLAIIYWQMIHSVGGIATHLNRLRDAAIRDWDTCDILFSASQKTKRPGLYPERKWIRGGDTNIWCCGEAPHHPDNVQETIEWLKKNYDAICFGYICPHKITAYPTPDFLPIYDIDLPKVAWVMDGYWDMYSHWAEPLLDKLDAVLCPLESYALPLRELGYDRVKISAFPFAPMLGSTQPKSKKPLVVWPNQWKDIKGIKPFLQQVPNLPTDVQVELYSCGIRYYQLRKEDTWKEAVGKDLFKEHNGNGRATYYGNVDHPVVLRALQRAWFTVNLQGMRSRKQTYKKGSYNNTEVEALWYGACPILHSSTLQTDLPPDTYIAVDSADEIPAKIDWAIKTGFALSAERRNKAREFVRSKHLASQRYQDLKGLLS